MFGSLAQLETRPPSETTPRHTHPSIPVVFPACELPTADDASEADEVVVPIAEVLRGVHRPTDLKVNHLRALGLRVVQDASPKQIVPDAQFLPPKEWESMTRDDCQNLRDNHPRVLSNQKISPSATTYIERRHELAINNDDAFRTVRRLPLAPGEKRARLGNAYEFFKNLELLAIYWKDTSSETEEDTQSGEESDKPEPATNAEQSELSTNTSLPPSSTPNVRTRGKAPLVPNEFRSSLINAFIKLVTYDYGCNVAMARVEPRLHLTVSPGISSQSASTLNTYYQSSCAFIYRTPTTRNEARMGVVEGPLAAVSIRPQTSFPTQQDSLLDFSKELLALLITAQYRAREGKSERRFGDGEWWTTAPRWGGGSGGPIGKEIELVEKQEREIQAASSSPSPTSHSGLPVSHNSQMHHAEDLEAKKQKKTRLQMYDSYRMVRPPSSTWDRKAKYMAIGKPDGAGFDDVFLISALFHHISLIRLRISDDVTAELEGATSHDGAPRKRRRQLVMYRSKWYDLFKPEDRIEALGVLWGIMGWSMRSSETAISTQDVSSAPSDHATPTATASSISSIPPKGNTE